LKGWLRVKIDHKSPLFYIYRRRRKKNGDGQGLTRRKKRTSFNFLKCFIIRRWELFSLLNKTCVINYKPNNWTQVVNELYQKMNHFLFLFFPSYLSSSLSLSLSLKQFTLWLSSHLYQKKHSSFTSLSPPPTMNISSTFTTTNRSATVQIRRSKIEKALDKRERENSWTMRKKEL